MKTLAPYTALGLPVYHSEDYQRTDPKKLFEGLSDAKSVALLFDDLPADEGLFVGPLSSFRSLHPDLADKYYGKIAEPDTDGFVRLNTTIVSHEPGQEVDDIVVIHFARNYRAPKPLRFFFPASQEQTVQAGRLLIIAEESAEATIMLEDYGAAEGLSLHVVEVVAEANSKIDIYHNEDAAQTSRSFASWHVAQYVHSQVSIVLHTLSSGLSRNNCYVQLLESEAEIKLAGLCIAKDGSRVDNFALIKHLAPNCHADELFKNIVGENGYAIFSSRIYVDKLAQKTLAYQNNRNLILAPSGKVHAKPQLEIYADDVKCSHGMTTGELDEDALFYLRQRGISDDEASRMLTLAFASEVTSRIRCDLFREAIRERIAERI